MRIIFDLRNVGLGNNGGSSTLIKSGNVLCDLGHEVFFIDNTRNRHTWCELKAPHIRAHKDEKIPDADVIIATGYKSVTETVSAPSRCGVKFHFIRGWETWQMPEQKIVSDILSAPTHKIVNSLCLQRKLKNYGVKSKVIRPGYDLEDFYKKASREYRKRFVIGGLFPAAKHFEIKRPEWVVHVYRALKKKYSNVNIELWMFGNDMIDEGVVDRYFQRPKIEEKNDFYNNVDLWLSPAKQEGLHIPPAEAMLTECPVVGTNADMSGTEDYLVHGHNGLVSDNTLESFFSNAEILLVNEPLRKEFGVNARKKIEELGSREDNMKKMVKHFMEYIK